MSISSPAARLVADLVAAADRQRRWRDIVGVFARTWPVVAGAVLLVAFAGRLAAWPGIVVPVLLGSAVTIAGLGVWMARRPRAATPAAAGRSDRDAGLGGELASAYWFAMRAESAPQSDDSWVSFHIDRAAANANGVDWQKIYAPPPVRRRLATGVLFSVLALAMPFVGAVREQAPSASMTLARTLAAALNDAEITPATRADLEALIATLERGEFTADDVSQASELIDMAAAADPALRERLQELLAKAAADTPRDLARADIDRPVARAASDVPPLQSDKGRSPSEEWALDERAAQQAAETAEQRGEPTGQSAAAGKESDADRSAAGSPGAEARDTVSALGASQVTLGDQVGDTNGASGYPMGGRSNGVTAPSVAITLPEALAREVVEAHDEVAGADVKTEEHRRQAEQASSGLTSTGSAARLTFDRAHVLPPSPVPEARRALIEGYFARP